MSALRTSITVSLLSPSSHLRSIRTHHRQLRIPALSPITAPRHQCPSSTAPHHRSHTPAAPRQAGRMTAEAVTYSVNPRQRRGVARVGSMRCGASPLKLRPSPTSYQADGRLAPLRASKMRYCPREAPNKNIFCQRRPSVNTEKHTAVPFLS